MQKVRGGGRSKHGEGKKAEREIIEYENFTKSGPDRSRPRHRGRSLAAGVSWPESRGRCVVVGELWPI